MHINTVQVHILDGFLFTSGELAFALTLNAIMIVVFIGSFHMFIVCYFFAGDSMQSSIMVDSRFVVVVGVVEL